MEKVMCQRQLSFIRRVGKTRKKPYIIHYSPFLINQLPTRSWREGELQFTWVIVINETEIENINPKEAENGKSIIWKLALWGNYRDKKAINRLEKLFPLTLDKIVQENKWHLHRGLVLQNNSLSKKGDLLPKLINQKVFDANLIGSYRFSIPEIAFSLISPEKAYVNKRAGQVGLTVMKAPHLVINPEYCVFSEQDFVIPDSQIGLSANEKDSDVLRALSIFLSSNVIRYYLFFFSASWGVGRRNINPKDISNIPIPDFTDEQVKELSNFQKELVELERVDEFSSPQLQNLLDEKIRTILKLPKNLSILIDDFVNVKLTLNTGNRTVTVATKMPSKEDLSVYGQCLRTELDNFVGDEKTHHSISIFYSKNWIICAVEILYSKSVIDISVSQINETSPKFSEIFDKLKQKFSQWIYIQRSLFVVEEAKVYIFRPSQLINWTRSQALKDSDGIIAEVLTSSIGSEVAS